MENGKKKLLENGKKRMENGKKRMETGQSNVGSNNERIAKFQYYCKKNQKKQKS